MIRSMLVTLAFGAMALAYTPAFADDTMEQASRDTEGATETTTEEGDMYAVPADYNFHNLCWVEFKYKDRAATEKFSSVWSLIYWQWARRFSTLAVPAWVCKSS